MKQAVVSGDVTLEKIVESLRKDFMVVEGQSSHFIILAN